ncbi:hypothetical protein [Aeromicrobium massiliense]|uniref:hypothetical protein n=1 Tax=Aeromicrobium massiliense TaxID=1464554 RepID=UPI00030E4BE5|nr:hypothetical protein [Aeromicrobium massiliense]
MIPLAAVVVLVEALALLGFAGTEVVAEPSRPMTYATAGLLTAYALGQAWAALLLLKHRIGARGPLVVTQLIQLGLAWNSRDSDLEWLSPVLVIAAVVALVGLLAPSTTRALVAAERVPE